jgi:hypothetical protein
LTIFIEFMLILLVGLTSLRLDSPYIHTSNRRAKPFSGFFGYFPKHPNNVVAKNWRADDTARHFRKKTAPRKPMRWGASRAGKHRSGDATAPYGRLTIGQATDERSG